MGYEHVKKWRRRTKAELKKAFGTKCGSCGYDRCDAALEMHHLDPTEKEFSISSSSSNNWAVLCAEARKCVLLCSNCHREVHAEVLLLSADIARFDISLTDYVLPVPVTQTPCKVCGKLKNARRSYCSTVCAGVASAVGRWDSVDLEALIFQGVSWAAIGRSVGVNGSSVKKRAKKLGLV